MTSASATFESINAAETNYNSLMQLSGAKKIIKDYHKEMNEIVGRMKTRLSVIESIKPKAPSLNTAARAELRRKRFEARMEKEYGKHWKDGDYRQSSADRIC